MKGHFITLLFIFPFYDDQLQAQTDLVHFNLDSFALPDIDRKALSASGSLSFSGQDYKSGPGETRHNDLSSNNNLKLSYSRFVNSIDRQSFWTGTFSPEFSHYRNSPPAFYNVNSETRFNPHASWSGYTRRFRGEKFIETGAFISTSYYSAVFVEKDTNLFSKEKPREIVFNVQPSIGFGHGRIESMSDVSIALFLLQDAVETGLGITTFTQEDVYAFASLMVKLRNERIFDSRKKRVEELRSLYEFMRAQQWVMQDDPGFFTVLTDNWLYNFSTSRNSGKQWRFLLTPGYRHENYVITYISGSESKIKRLSEVFNGKVSAEFYKSRQINLGKQVSRDHFVFAQYTDSRISGDFSDDQQELVEVGFSNAFQHDWYPNTRTRLGARLDIDYSYMKQFSGPEDVNHALLLNLGGSTDYFISYRTRFTASANIRYRYSSNLAFPNFISFSPLIGIRQRGIDYSFQAGFITNIF